MSMGFFLSFQKDFMPQRMTGSKTGNKILWLHSKNKDIFRSGTNITDNKVNIFILQ